MYDNLWLAFAYIWLAIGYILVGGLYLNRFLTG